MGQASSRKGYDTVPDVESVPLSAANLQARNQQWLAEPQPTGWPGTSGLDAGTYQGRLASPNGEGLASKAGALDYERRSDAISAASTRTADGFERDMQGFPPYYVDDGPLLPRAPFPMHSVLEKRDALDPSFRSLLVWERWLLTILYVGWYVVGLPNMVWHLIRNGTIKTDDWFLVLMAYVIFNLIWQFTDLFFVVRFHLRNRQRLTYGYEAVLGVGPEVMQPTECPHASAIIVAYLPNEQGIIMQTLMHFVEMHYEGGLTIILAYNTPDELAVEQEIRDLEQCYPNFQAVRVHDSTSKSDNVNGVLHKLKGEFVGIFDSDHVPMPGSFECAWRNLEQGFHYVQGRTKVNHRFADDWLGRGVAAEFEVRHGVDHVTRNTVYHVAMFGGSNGFWRIDTLKYIGMDPRMLTEDIDASIRAMLYGFRGVYDHNLVSLEQPPPDFPALIKQRLRWTQGWYQVAYRASSRLGSFGKNLTNAQLLGLYWLWTMAMPVRIVLSHWIAFTVAIISSHVGAWLCFVLTSTWLLPQAVVCCFFTELPTSWKVNFVVNLLPGFALELITHLVSQVRFLMGVSTWTVTTRKNDVSGRESALMQLKMRREDIRGTAREDERSEYAL